MKTSLVFSLFLFGIGGHGSVAVAQSEGTFTATGNMTTGRIGHTATLLLDGKVLIAGGSQGGDGSTYSIAASAERYDPATGTFPNGDIYDPATDTVSPIASPNRTQYGTATLLMSGKVLLTGDMDDYFFFYKTTQLYELSTGTFTVAGSMTISRGGHTTTLLPDGTVLIAGTQLLGGVASASAEIYDPVLGTFEPTGSMIRARFGHKATLLNNGQVLMTGGNDRAFYPFPVTSSAELYIPRVLLPAPVLLSLSGDGQGQGAIWHATTGQVASANNPAVAGEVLSMYTTSLADGGVIPPQVAISGRLAEVQYFGGSGYPGYNQVNFRLPDGVPPGAAVSVRLTYMGRSSNAVGIGVQ